MTTPRQDAPDRVVNRVKCDIAVVKIMPEASFKRILLPTAGGPHSEFASELLGPIVEAQEVEVTACYVVPEDAGEDVKREAHSWV